MKARMNINGNTVAKLSALLLGLSMSLALVPTPWLCRKYESPGFAEHKSRVCNGSQIRTSAADVAQLLLTVSMSDNALL